MRMGLDRYKIIKIAADMADEKGSSDVSFKELAEELGIRPPSLYKHSSGGLDELNRELMLYGWRLIMTAGIALLIKSIRSVIMGIYVMKPEQP